MLRLLLILLHGKNDYRESMTFRNLELNHFKPNIMHQSVCGGIKKKNIYILGGLKLDKYIFFFE